MHSSPMPADVTTPLSPKSEAFLLFSQVYLIILWKKVGFYKSIWIFASNVDTHCLNRLFYKIPWQTRWLEMKGLTVFAPV